MEKFGVARFMYDDDMINYYTNFDSVKCFHTFFNHIKCTANTMSYSYHQCSVEQSQTPRVNKSNRTMLLVDEFFMFLCRLKVGLMAQDLAVRFNVSKSTVSRKVITWCNLLYFILGSIPIWAPKDVIDSNMPAEFKVLYPKTRVVIDCTEIKMERPSSMALGSKCYSTYKSGYTLKSLVGIAPHGALTFVSSLFTGNMSDVEITKLSNILDLLQPGDEIMADKGFTLDSILEGTGVTLCIPPFLSSQGQFTPQEIEATQTLAKLRIHIERHIRRAKAYHLFDGIIPMTLFGSINQLWAVANLLTLFKGPLIKGWC